MLSEARGVKSKCDPISFTLSRDDDGPLGEPPIYLRKALKENGIDEGQFIIMKFGETLRLSNEGVVRRMIH